MTIFFFSLLCGSLRFSEVQLQVKLQVQLFNLVLKVRRGLHRHGHFLPFAVFEDEVNRRELLNVLVGEGHLHVAVVALGGALELGLELVGNLAGQVRVGGARVHDDPFPRVVRVFFRPNRPAFGWRAVLVAHANVQQPQREPSRLFRERHKCHWLFLGSAVGAPQHHQPPTLHKAQAKRLARNLVLPLQHGHQRHGVRTETHDTVGFLGAKQARF
mmetsp:Transcript_24457/g.48793  ORF Transcript_24457/g.48793 Transcript_24457/m.48793 type:complete len:215 (-) Transcript_24457:613-1257(-)